MGQKAARRHAWPKVFCSHDVRRQAMCFCFLRGCTRRTKHVLGKRGGEVNWPILSLILPHSPSPSQFNFLPSHPTPHTPLAPTAPMPHRHPCSLLPFSHPRRKVIHGPPRGLLRRPNRKNQRCVDHTPPLLPCGFVCKDQHHHGAGPGDSNNNKDTATMSSVLRRNTLTTGTLALLAPSPHRPDENAR